MFGTAKGIETAQLRHVLLTKYISEESWSLLGQDTKGELLDAGVVKLEAAIDRTIADCLFELSDDPVRLID